MAKPKDTFNKKEKEKKRLKEREEKREKMQERKANAKKGKSLDEMMAYLDENGNISDTPPDPRAAKKFRKEDIQIGVPKQEHIVEEMREGVVSFFDDSKGFGFIKDSKTGDRIFIHISVLTEPVKENDKVLFKIERGPRGPNAVNIKKQG